MKDIAYANGIIFKEKEINTKWILDSLRYSPDSIFDRELKQFLIEDEDILDDCLEILIFFRINKNLFYLNGS